MEAARALAELVLKAKSTDEERIQLAFVRLTGRRPEPREFGVLQRTLEEQRIEFRKDVIAASKLIAVGGSKADPDLRPSELAAMTVCVQTILNSDATAWKR